MSEVQRTKLRVVKGGLNGSGAAVANKAAEKRTITERVLCNTSLAIISALLIAFTMFLALRPRPMTPSDGVIYKEVDGKYILTDSIQTGDQVVISWTQTWKDLCSIEVTRFLVDGSDVNGRVIEFKEPRLTNTVILYPPVSLGTYPDKRTETIKVPPMVGPRGKYIAVAHPKCWTDYIWPREFQSPAVEFNVIVPAALISPNQKK